MSILSIRTDVPGMIVNHNIRIASDRLSATMERISTGSRINKASDDPIGLALSENLRAELSGYDSLLRSIDSGKTATDTADKGMEQLSTILQDALKAAKDANNNGLATDDAGMSALMTGLQEAYDNVVLATTVSGKSILSDEKLTYALDQTAAAQVEVGEYKVDSTNSTAIKAAWDAIGTAEWGGTDGVSELFEAALTELSTARSANGTKATSFTAVKNVQVQKQVGITAQESAIRDLDTAQAELDLVRDQLLLNNAAVVSGIGTQRQSLIASLLG